MGKAKLTNNQIDEIKKLYVPSKGGNRKGNDRSHFKGSMAWLANRFYVSVRAIHTVVHGVRKYNQTRAERFMSHVYKTETCWLWTGSIDRDGYGTFAWSSTEKGLGAHRASFKLFKGKIRRGFGVLHTCDNRACVRPIHLFQGTQIDNMQDMVEKGRTLWGEKNHAAKLTNEQVREIRTRYCPVPPGRPTGSTEPNPDSIRSLAVEFKVSRRTIQNIVQNKRYQRV